MRKIGKEPFKIILTILVIIVFGVCSLFILFYYNVYHKQLKNDTVMKASMELSESVGYMDNTLVSMEQLVNSMMIRNRVLELMESDCDYTTYHSVMDDLKTIKDRHAYIHSVCLVVPEKNLVLTSDAGYYSQNEFNDHVWEVNQELAQIGSNACLQCSPIRKLSLRSRPEADVISMMFTYKGSVGDQLGDIGYLVINIDWNKMIKGLDIDKWQVGGDSSDLLIVSGDNQLVLFDGGTIEQSISTSKRSGICNSEADDYKETTLDGKKALIFNVKSEYSGWNFIRVLTDYRESMNLDRVLSVIIFIVIAGMAALVYMLFSIWKNLFQPYVRLAGIVKTGGVNGATISEMKGWESLILKAIEKKEILTEAYLSNLLLGIQTVDTEEMDMLKLNTYYIILAKLKMEEESSVALSEISFRTLEQDLKQYWNRFYEKDSVYLVRMNADRIVIALNGMEQKCTDEILRKRIMDMHQKIEARDNVFCTIGISECHDSELELKNAYKEAQKALSIHYFFEDRNIIYYQDAKVIRNEFYMEDPVKQQILIKNLYNMNIKEARKNLEAITEGIKKDLNEMIYYNLPNYYSRIFERIYKAACNLGVEPSEFFGINRVSEGALHVWEYDTMRETLQDINQMLDRLEAYEVPKDSIRNKDVQLREWMLAYVEKNYDKGISLTTMAEGLGISESYLSRQFKEKTGMSFLQYVTDLRMEKAKELLENTDMKIAEITEYLAIGNEQGFIRSFKKHEGTTPGQYRKQKKMNMEK